LLDECLPSPLARDLAGHEARSVTAMGWAGLRNGALLRHAERDFDVFLTLDRNLSFQQDVSRFALAVVIMAAPSNRLRDLRPLISKVLLVVVDIKPGQVVTVR
jgi:hypothetical protein